jgi:hypothetical protein
VCACDACVRVYASVCIDAERGDDRPTDRTDRPSGLTYPKLLFFIFFVRAMMMMRMDVWLCWLCVWCVLLNKQTSKVVIDGFTFDDTLSHLIRLVLF